MLIDPKNEILQKFEALIILERSQRHDWDEWEWKRRMNKNAEWDQSCRLHNIECMCVCVRSLVSIEVSDFLIEVSELASTPPNFFFSGGVAVSGEGCCDIRREVLWYSKRCRNIQTLILLFFLNNYILIYLWKKIQLNRKKKNNN
jgi:hypothetical protein